MYKIPTTNIEELRGKSIYIYGASIGGRIVSEILDSERIDYSFCDIKKKGMTFRGKIVRDPLEAARKENAVVLIAGTRSFDSQCQYMIDQKQKNIFNVCDLLQRYELLEANLSEFEKVAISDYIDKYKIYSSTADENIELHTLDVIITEKCTLKCRDCSALMPRYCNPKEYDISEVIGNIQKVLEHVERIVELVIVGGEPLCHKNLSLLLKWGNEESRISNITIISNGTIFPSESIWKELTGTKSRLRLSDYGSLSYRKREVIECARARGANCFVQRLEEWQDMGTPCDRGSSLLEKEKLFKDCPFSYSTFLLGTKLFRCGHAAHIFNLGILNSSSDYYDFEKSNDVSLKQYMDSTTYLNACGYCNGVGKDREGICQAIQIDGRKPEYED